MINGNSLGFFGQFYFGLKDNFKKIYQNSNFYEKKISKTFDNNFQYKPSPHLLSSIIKYQNKKYRIEDFALESIWQDKIKQLKKIQQEKKLNFDIEIDGGINFENCKIAIDAGANILVSGTTVFKSNGGDVKKNINLLKLK